VLRSGEKGVERPTVIAQDFSRVLNFEKEACRKWKEGHISEEELTKMQLGRSRHTKKT